MGKAMKIEKNRRVRQAMKNAKNLLDEEKIKEMIDEESYTLRDKRNPLNGVAMLGWQWKTFLKSK